MPRTIATAKRSIADVSDAQLQAAYRRLNSALNPFDCVSQDLTDIGALSIESFLSKSNGLEDLDVAFHLRVPPERVASPPHVSQPHRITKRSSSQSPPVLKEASALAPLEAPSVPAKRDYSPINVLHQTCQRAFGTSVNFLNFEFLEDDPKGSAIFLQFYFFTLNVDFVTPRETVHTHYQTPQWRFTIIQDRARFQETGRREI